MHQIMAIPLFYSFITTYYPEGGFGGAELPRLLLHTIQKGVSGELRSPVYYCIIWDGDMGTMLPRDTVSPF
jgi:hypothetical protein